MLLPSWSQIALSMRIRLGCRFRVGCRSETSRSAGASPSHWLGSCGLPRGRQLLAVAELVAELIGKDRHARKTCEIQVSRVVPCCIGKWHLHRNWVSMATLDALLDSVDRLDARTLA